MERLQHRGADGGKVGAQARGKGGLVDLQASRLGRGQEVGDSGSVGLAGSVRVDPALGLQLPPLTQVFTLVLVHTQLSLESVA
eukprot:evm.model.NODE_50820_length_14285_cov_58.232552.1